MRRSMRRTAMLATVIVAASCAQPGKWENPNLPWEEWSRIEADCRALAQEQAEREFRATRQQSSTATTLSYDQGGQWLSQMDRFDAQRRQQTLFERCMTNQGFRLVPRD